MSPLCFTGGNEIEDVESLWSNAARRSDAPAPMTAPPSRAAENGSAIRPGYAASDGPWWWRRAPIARDRPLLGAQATGAANLIELTSGQFGGMRPESVEVIGNTS